MSLLDASSYDCVMLDRTTIPDGYGGIISTWVLGARFNAAIALDDSTQAQTALALGAKGVYTVATKRNVMLRYHDVFTRQSDNKIFRVVTDGEDKKTPSTAGLDMRVVKAEEWQLPEDTNE